MTWFLSSRGTKHLHHLLKLVGFMGAQHLWKLGYICLVCSADGEEATEIHFLLENLFFVFFFFFSWELSVDWCIISPSADIPTRPRTERHGKGLLCCSLGLPMTSPALLKGDSCPCDRMYHAALGPPGSRVYLGRTLLSPLLHSHPAETWVLPLGSS